MVDDFVEVFFFHSFYESKIVALILLFNVCRLRDKLLPNQDVKTAKREGFSRMRRSNFGEGEKEEGRSKGKSLFL